MASGRRSARHGADGAAGASAEGVDETMLEAGDVDKGMIPKLSSVCDALKGGVEAAQIVDGRVLHSVIMELFTEEGLGTMVTRA